MATAKNKYTLAEAAGELGINLKTLQWRLRRGTAIACGENGARWMTTRQIADAKKRRPKLGRPFAAVVS